MNRELNKIFDVKTREARRRILDKFDISKEDKNEVLNKIGEGGGSGGNSSIEYLDVSGMDELIRGAISSLAAYLIRINLEGNINIIPAAMVALLGFDISTSGNIIKYISTNLNDVVVNDADAKTITYLLTMNGFTQEQLDAIPRITKEEFYSLKTITPSGNKFTLIVDDPESGQKSITYTYKEGQTWENWIASENNIGSLTIYDMSDFGYSLNIRGGVITKILGSNGAIIYNAENKTSPANPTDIIGTKIYYCYGPEL